MVYCEHVLICPYCESPRITSLLGVHGAKWSCEYCGESICYDGIDMEGDLRRSDGYVLACPMCLQTELEARADEPYDTKFACRDCGTESTHNAMRYKQVRAEK